MFTMLKRSRRLALTEGVTAGVMFGTAAIFIRLLEPLNFSSIAFWRLIVASAVLGGTTLVLKKPFSLKALKENRIQLLVLGTLLGLHFIFFVSAVADTTILNATVLVNTTPIFSLFIFILFFKQKPSLLAAVGLATSFLGVTLIAYADFSPIALSIRLKGDLEALSAAFVEALYLNYGRKIRSKLSLFSIMLPIYLVAAFTVWLLCSLTGCPVNFSVQPNYIFFLVGLGILPTAIAHTLYFSSLSNLQSFETATLALLEPIGATLLGLLIFAEAPAALFVLGAFLVLCGILSVAKGE
ncbi:MAG: DMT family transporter [Thermoproteota archaeon]|nr:DMT family transporter [Thermoproteota archaeon]